MTLFTINNILERYGTDYPKKYEEFIVSLMVEVEKNENRHYDLFGVLSIGLDTEITDELLLESCEKLINIVLNDNPSYADFCTFQKNNKFFKVLKNIRSEFYDSSNDCCNIFGSTDMESPITDNTKNISFDLKRNHYLLYNLMDEPNKKAMDIMQNDGMNAAVEHMMTRPDGTQRSYAEMRELYG